MILTSGEKIKKLRADLNLKQSDIADDQVSRNFISMLENEKTKLSHKVALIISEKVKKICEKNGVPFTYSAEYLMESIEVQVNRQCNTYIQILKGASEANLSQEILEIEDFTTKYSHYDTIELSLELANYYDRFQMYQKEYHVVYTAFAAQIPSFQSLLYIRLLLSLTYCCIRLEKYSDALKYSNYALNHYTFLLPRHIFAFKYNRMLSFLNLKQYQDVIEEVKQMNENFSYSDDQKINSNTLLALAHMYLGNFDTAESILLAMHEKAAVTSSAFKRMNLSNLLRLALEKNDLECIKIYYEKCMQSLKEENESSYHQGVKDLFVDLTLSNIRMGDFEQAVRTCQSTFDFCIKRNHFKTAIQCVDLMVEVYKATLHSPYLKQAKDYFLELLNYDLNELLTPSFLNLQSTFFYIGDCKNAHQLCRAFKEVMAS